MFPALHADFGEHGNPDFVTRHGRPVWWLHPERTRVVRDELLDVARSQLRYLGHYPVTLLQHTALVRGLVELHSDDPLDHAYAVAHDLHEVFVGDLPSRMKAHLPTFKPRIEHPWETHVHRALELPWPVETPRAQLIKAADLRALVIEMTVHDHPAAQLAAAGRGGLPTENELALWHLVEGTEDGELRAECAAALDAGLVQLVKEGRL